MARAGDDMALTEEKRHLERAYFKHGARAFAAGAGIAEAGIEKTGIVHPEFADQGIEWHHFRGVVGRHLDRFLRRQNVECDGIEDEAALGQRRYRLPDFSDNRTATAIDIDHAGVTLGAVADESAGVLAGKVDAQRHAVDEIGVVAIDQPLQIVQRIEFIGVQDGIAGAKTDLAEPRSLAQQHRKRLGACLGLERPGIARAGSSFTVCRPGTVCPGASVTAITVVAPVSQVRAWLPLHLVRVRATCPLVILSTCSSPRALRAVY